MTPPKHVTRQQIDKAVANYRALIEKHVPQFESAAVQTVLGQSELAGEMFGLFRARVEAQSNMIVRRVKVNRLLTQQEMLDETGRRQYTDGDVVATIPKGEGEEVDVYFFNVGRYVPADELAKEYELRGLTIDPAAQAAVNRDDSAFADEHPNGCQWQDADGRHCYLAFGRWHGGRGVDVDRRDRGWSGRWWFSGVRK